METTGVTMDTKDISKEAQEATNCTETEEDAYFKNENGQNIFCKYWKPQVDPPRALVFLSHGVCEHCSLYDVIAVPMTQRGMLVFAHDHIGHGQSEGERVQISDFNLYVKDVIQHVSTIRNQYPDSPLFILGHSMGGAIAILSVLNHIQLFKGMVLISPAILPSPETATKFKVTMAKVLSRVAPSVHVGKADSKWFSRDPEVGKKCDNDPLTYQGGLKARLALSIMKAMDEIKKRMEEITLPWLDIHGDQDKLTELSGSKLLNEKSASTDKTLNIYSGAYHQVHNEPEGVGQRCVQEVISWIEARI